MKQTFSKALFWHRRDLRNVDNAGLYKALTQSEQVIPVFIFDTTILQHLPQDDLRVTFIYKAIQELKQSYVQLGSDLTVVFGDPIQEIPKLAVKYGTEVVFTNRDYEPTAISRDKQVAENLATNSIAFMGAKDHVIFEKSEICKDDKTPYTVFTPYSKKWLNTLNPFFLKPYPTEKYFKKLIQIKTPSILIPLNDMGFKATINPDFPSDQFPIDIIKNYTETRDIPAIAGTSRLSVHLRFGTISIRALAQVALDTNTKFLGELIWRDFYQMILFHFPNSPHQAIKPAYDKIPWVYDEKLYACWCQGKTGYPLVDAGMRELNATGFMHNRVRMVVASFFTKHLLHDWRLGERYFALKLLDFDLASNVGGWQWAAGSGCDAAPYFRIFNPTSQQERFDPDFTYIKKWVPEYGTSHYTKPIVDHKLARENTLAVYKNALNS